MSIFLPSAQDNEVYLSQDVFIYSLDLFVGTVFRDFQVSIAYGRNVRQHNAVSRTEWENI